MAYALFIRVVVVVPQTWHSLTRYGSRENSAFSGLELSVCIWTLTACGVSRSQAEHASDMSAPSFVAAIPALPFANESIKTPNRPLCSTPFIPVPKPSGPFDTAGSVQGVYRDISNAKTNRSRMNGQYIYILERNFEVVLHSGPNGHGMDKVFAPWRIEWVEREASPDVDCVFCAFRGEETDRVNNVVARSDRAFVLLNNYPYNPGHVMVIPHDHTGDYTDLDDETLLDHAKLKQRTFDALETALEPDAFNAGLNLGGSAAGGSIDDHVHTHVVPRWDGDTNFMPVISDTKVIVEAVAETYDRLHEAFGAQDGAHVEDAETAVRIE